MMLYRFLPGLCLGFALAVLGVVSIAAQDNQQPLLTMLSRVPDTPTSRSEIFFNNRRAIEAAYPPARMPANWAEFMTLLQGISDDKDLFPPAIWWRVWSRTVSSSQRFFMESETMPEVVGFDTFAIDQELNYGQPPENTLQLTGHFDLEAVRAAFSANGFVKQGQAEAELWCGPEGCDSGSRTDFGAINPANLFGGDLGRKQPLLISDGALISSPDDQVINDHLALLEGRISSLADAPEYRAAVESVTADGILLQAYIWDGELLNRLSDPPHLPESITPEQQRELLQRMLEDYETLPAYELLVFADTVTDIAQMAHVALVYSDMAMAQRAATILPVRIASYQSQWLRRPIVEVLKQRGVAEPQVQVIKNAETGKIVVLLSFATLKATPDQILALTPGSAEPPDVAAPGLIYRLMVNLALRMDLGWLSTLPRETLEQLANG
jgi:hypothetical protein